MSSPRPLLRAAVPAAAVLWVGALGACAPREVPPEVVAPIVLTEPTGPQQTTTDVGAEPVQPPGPATAGDGPDTGQAPPAPDDDDLDDDDTDDGDDDTDDGDDEDDDEDTDD